MERIQSTSRSITTIVSLLSGITVGTGLVSHLHLAMGPTPACAAVYPALSMWREPTPSSVPDCEPCVSRPEDAPWFVPPGEAAAKKSEEPKRPALLDLNSGVSLTESRHAMADLVPRDEVPISSRLTVSGGIDGVLRADGSDVGSAILVHEQENRGTQASLYDLTFNWRAFKAGDATVSVLSGVRAATFWLPTAGDERSSGLTPVIGSAVAVPLNDQTTLSASATTQMPGANDKYLDFRIENIWRVGERSTLSLGYQYLRNVYPDEALAARVRREALVIECRIPF